MVSMTLSKGPTGVRLTTRPPCKATLELEDSSCQTKLLFHELKFHPIGSKAWCKAALELYRVYYVAN